MGLAVIFIPVNDNDDIFIFDVKKDSSGYSTPRWVRLYSIIKR